MSSGKIRAGLYRLDVKCPKCKVWIRAERCDPDGVELSSEREFRWECFCPDCGECDPDGYPTLAECRIEAREQWQEVAP